MSIISNRPNGYNPVVRNRFYNQPHWTEYRYQDYYDDDYYDDSISIRSPASSYWNDYHKYDDIIWPETMDLMNEPEMEAIGLRHMGESWVVALQNEIHELYFTEIACSVYYQRMIDRVSPYPEKVFNWTRHCNFADVRVVIVAQDPYCDPYLAQGLAFSVQNFQSMQWRDSCSLANISQAVAYSELGMPIGSPEFELPIHGDLTPWAEQGVLLLNTFLTVGRKPMTHRHFGWSHFSDAVIKAINDNCEHVVYMLWGNEARTKKHLIDRSRHLVLETTHPSPRLGDRNRFFWCNHFAIANQYLLNHDNGMIDWCGAFWPDGLPF